MKDYWYIKCDIHVCYDLNSRTIRHGLKGAGRGGGRVLILLHFLFDLLLQQAAKTYDVWVVDLTFAGITDTLNTKLILDEKFINYLINIRLELAKQGLAQRI